MSSNWKHILKQSGDANIGATLIRLAHQATELHLHEIARAAEDETRAGGTGPQAAALASSDEQEGVR